jgi:hypothetical protein
VTTDRPVDLAAYLAHPYAREGIAPSLLAWPLPDEPHVAHWEVYAERAAHDGVWPTLRAIFPQLRCPIEAGVSQREEYAAATRRGRADATDAFAPGLVLDAPEQLRLAFSDGAGGRLPVLTTPVRADFERLVQALTERNEPAPVPPSMGACFVKGLINWDRVAEHRRRWEAAEGAEGDDDAWRVEMGRLSANKALYQDRFIILSRGPYSGVAAADAGMDEAAWLDRSHVIRREHELTHNFTWRIFGIMRSHATDELVADFVGLVRAFGHYPVDLARRFLGVERHPAFRSGGRLANYRGNPPMSDGDFARLCELAYLATANLGHLAESRRDDLRDPLHLARVTFELTLLDLEALASRDLTGLGRA